MMRRRKAGPPSHRRAATPALAALAGLVLCAALGCQSGPPPSLVEQGEAALRDGAYRRADELFRQALAEDPQSGQALHGRARVAVRTGDPEQALRHYSELARVDRAYFRSSTRADYARALVDAGNARVDRRQPAKALEALRVAQRVKPDEPGLPAALARALTAQGERLTMRGRRGEALAHYGEAIELAPDQVDAYVGAVEVRLASGQKKEALDLLSEARKRHPGDSRLRTLMVQAMGLQ